MNLGAGAVCDIIDNIDRDPDADASVCKAQSGKFETRTRKGVSSVAYVADSYAHAGIAEARASALKAGASAHYGYDGVSASANAELAYAEAKLGPVGVGVGLKANTGVSAGPDGVSLDVLGFGF